MKVIHIIITFLFFLIAVKLYNAYEVTDDEDYQKRDTITTRKDQPQILKDKFDNQNLTVITPSEQSQAAFYQANQLANLCIVCAERNFFKCPNPDDPFIGMMCSY